MTNKITIQQVNSSDNKYVVRGQDFKGYYYIFFSKDYTLDNLQNDINKAGIVDESDVNYFIANQFNNKKIFKNRGCN